jgi:NADPH-dependent F420 reductase
MSQVQVDVGVVGGTGELGGAIARRLVRAGKRVMIGSRTVEKAQAAAAELRKDLGVEVWAGSNTDAAQAASTLIVTVPYASQSETLQAIRPYVSGKLVIDTTVPLVPPKVMRVQLPAEGSAALVAQKVLGPQVKVVSAFHNVAAAKLAMDAPVDCDVLVFGEEKANREAALELVKACGLRGVHGGSLANSAAAEALTSVLIFINKTYGSPGSGIRLTGLPEF